MQNEHVFANVASSKSDHNNIGSNVWSRFGLIQHIVVEIFKFGFIINGRYN